MLRSVCLSFFWIYLALFLFLGGFWGLNACYCRSVHHFAWMVVFVLVCWSIELLIYFLSSSSFSLWIGVMWVSRRWLFERFFWLKGSVLAHEMRSFCFSLLIAWVGTWYDVIWMLTGFLLTNIFCVVFFIIHFKILKNLFDEAFCFCAWYRRYSVLLLFNNWNRGCEGVFLDFELLWDLA